MIYLEGVSLWAFLVSFGYLLAGLFAVTVEGFRQKELIVATKEVLREMIPFLMLMIFGILFSVFVNSNLPLLAATIAAFWTGANLRFEVINSGGNRSYYDAWLAGFTTLVGALSWFWIFG